MEREPVGFLLQFRAMLARNLIIKKRQPSRTFAELAVPIYFLIILVIVKLLLPEPNYPPIQQELGSSPVNLLLLLKYLNGSYNEPITVVPDNDNTREFISHVQNTWSHLIPTMLGQLPELNITFLSSEADLEQIYSSRNSSQDVHLAIIFSDDPFTNRSYTIRNNPSKVSLPPPGLLFGSGANCRDTHSNYTKFSLEYGYSCPINSYYYSNFLAIQTLLETTWLKNMSSDIIVDNYLTWAVMQLLPKSSYVDDVAVTVLRYIVPFYMVLTLSQFIMYLLTVVIGEKEKKIKEGLRMMGLRDSVYWLSWLTIYTVLVALLSLIALIVLFGVGILKHSNIGFIYLLFLLYGISILALAFLITPFFDKARIAGIFGAMVVSFLNLFYYIQVAAGDSVGEVVYWLLSLISPTAFALAMDKALLLDIDLEKGVSMDTMWDGPSMPFGGALIMLSVDIVLYVLLAYYLDSVLPSEYGAKQPPWFCLMPSFWCGSNKGKFKDSFKALDDTGIDPETVSANGSRTGDIETVSPSLRGKEAVKVRGLCKTFSPFGKPSVAAVKGLNLDVYEGQITAILGHNGAGKTTFFNMLTGMTVPTKGTAFIYGRNIRDSGDRQEIRRLTGICPQHDVLFDLLTPREHLAFFARIRGIPLDKTEEEVEKTLKDIDLSSKGDIRSTKLSGGQKRKLSIGIALIGDPKIVFLDEPTAGVDPYSRRHLWSLLQKRKAGKVILLTTHFMDEADLLADRKAIISKGELRCCGTSLFLKNRFGIGYHLTFVLEDKLDDTTPLQLLIKSYIPNAHLNRHYGRELSFVLPREDVSKFPPLLLTLESSVKAQSHSQMGYTSYGISMTTLEEVFLKLGEEDETNEEAAQANVNGKKENSKRTEDNTILKSLTDLEVPIKKPNTSQSARALFKIRGLNMFRDPMAVFFQVFMPVAFGALGIWLATLQSTKLNQGKRELNSGMYADELQTPLLYNSTKGEEISPFIDILAQYLNVTSEPYDKDYSNLLESSPHWAAVDLVKSPIPLQLQVARLRFNDTLMHMPPILINAISNSFLLQKNISENISLSVHPLPNDSPTASFDPGQFTSAMFIGMLFVLAPSVLCVEIVADRENMVKNLLRVNGLSFGLYFGTFFVVLGCMMLTTCILILALIFAFQLKSLITPPAITILAILYVLYCPAGILFGTCTSYFFKKMETAQSVFPNVSAFIGFVPYIVVSMCDMFKVGGSNEVATILHIIFCLTDTLYIPYGILYYVNSIYITCLYTPVFDSHIDVEEKCANLGFSEYMNLQVIIVFVALIIQIPIYFILLVIIDVKKSGGMAVDAFPFLKNSKPKDVERVADERLAESKGDSDVQTEQQRVERLLQHTDGEQPVVLVHNLKKQYTTGETKNANLCGKTIKSKAIPAVRSISLAVESGEVFGLLGHNGAGKTTTMKIITAEEAPTHGKVQVAGKDISSNLSDAFQALGYCPQFDCLWRNITVREHLETYAAIRGIVPSHIPRIIDLFLRGLQIEEHASKYAKDCSGGTRRKLSYAISMLGSPAIVLMDEPSTGMDPQSKRFLWNTIAASFKGKKGAILTTHSMEEADALCSRIGIMVKGELRCLGTSQHLKNRYGSGYMLEVKLKSLSSEINEVVSVNDVEQTRHDRKESLSEFIKKLFSSAEIHESFEDRLIFRIAQDNVHSLAETFQALESARENLHIEEYSFSQTTLEQVFIKFAHEQEQDDEEPTEETMSSL